MLSYAIFVIFAGGAALRDASGNVDDLSILLNGTSNGTPKSVPDCVTDNYSCKYGLFNSYEVNFSLKYKG